MRKRKSKAAHDDPAAQLLLQRLKELAERTGVAVREERLVREVGYHVHSGACRLEGQDVLLLDSGAPLGDRIEAALQFLSERDLDGVYLDPDLRRMLRGRGGSDEAQTA
jgi:predicted phosphoribosyltransferase